MNRHKAKVSIFYLFLTTFFRFGWEFQKWIICLFVCCKYTYVSIFLINRKMIKFFLQFWNAAKFLLCFCFLLVVICSYLNGFDLNHEKLFIRTVNSYFGLNSWIVRCEKFKTRLLMTSSFCEKCLVLMSFLVFHFPYFVTKTNNFTLTLC